MRPGHLRGITAMLACVACFAVMDAILKFFAGRYPPMEVGALRGGASLPFVLAAVALRGQWRDLRPVRWDLHLIRGLLALAIVAGFVYAVRALSLANAYAIFFIAPLLVTAMAVPMLGERVDAARWAAIVIGLAGVLIIVRPSASGLSTLGAIGALGSAIAYALSAISVRVLTRTDTTASMVLWFLVLLTVLAGLIAAPGWVSVSTEHWPWLAGLGLSGALGQHFITEAFRHAPASVVAPLEYTALLWGVALDWTFWDTIPGWPVVLGAPVIIGSGLFLIWRERQLHVEVASAIERTNTPP